MYVIASMKELEGKKIRRVTTNKHLNEVEIITEGGGVFVGEMIYDEMEESIDIVEKETSKMEERIKYMEKENKEEVNFIKEVIKYEVEGKLYDTKEEAEKEMNMAIAFKIQAIVHDVMMLYKVSDKLTAINESEPYLKITDKIFIAEYFKENKAHKVLKEILHELNLSYNYSKGDEKTKGTMEILVSRPKCVPSVTEIIEKF